MGILSSNQRKIWTDLSYVLSNMATNLKDSKLSVVILIYCSFLVDNILLTMVVPIIPDYLERINTKSDKITFNNLTGELNGTLAQSSKEPSTSTSSSLPPTSTATSITPTTTSTSSSASPPSSSSSLPLFLPTSTSLLSPSFLSSPSSLNGNIFIQWNQSKESLGSFGEKISYRKLLEGKVVNRRKKDYEKEQDDGEKEIGNEDGDDQNDEDGHDDGNDDRKEKKVKENEDEDGKSYRLIVKANKSLNTLMEGQTDWTGSKKVMNPPENEPIDWKSIPIRRSRIVELMLKDKFGDAGNPKEKDSHIGYGTYDSHRHYHPHYYHHFHNHHLSNAPKTNIQGIEEDKMDDNQEERLVGTLFASKAVFQLLFNPVSMKLIQSYGHNCTQTIALMVLLCSSLTYAFSQGIKTMFLARCIHGIGSSIISISVVFTWIKKAFGKFGTLIEHNVRMATIANLFQDEKARCQIMGISLGGIAAGVLVGYPFGGFAYDFCGKQLPFLLIAFLFTLIIGNNTFPFKPKVNSVNFVLNFTFDLVITFHANGETGFQLTFMPNEKEIILKVEKFNFVEMVKDLDIMLAIGSIFFTTSITAVLEPILPIYLIDSLNAPEWQLGIAFLPDALGYITGAHILGFDKHSVDKWVITIISLFLAGFATILIPLTTHFYQLIIPQFASGLSIGITDAAMSTQLASIVDDRYSANYSMIYTFSQIAVCLAYIIGPIVSSIVLPTIGTTGSFHVLGIIVILYGIVCISYRLYLAEIFGRNLSEVIPILSWNSYETIENP